MSNFKFQIESFKTDQGREEDVMAIKELKYKQLVNYTIYSEILKQLLQIYFIRHSTCAQIQMSISDGLRS